MMWKRLSILLLVLVLLLPAAAVQAQGGKWVSLEAWCVGMEPAGLARWEAGTSVCAVGMDVGNTMTADVLVNLQIAKGETLIVDVDNALRNQAQIQNAGQMVALHFLLNTEGATIRNSGYIETWILGNEGTIVNAGYLCADVVNMGSAGKIRAHPVVSCSTP